VICPMCDGKGRTKALMKVAGQGCVQQILVCRTCGGSGQIDEAKQALLEAGTRLRTTRVSRHLTQREVAHVCRLDPAVYNDHEWGRGSATVPSIEALITVVQRLHHTREGEVGVSHPRTEAEQRTFLREALRTGSHWLIVVGPDEGWFLDPLLRCVDEEARARELWPRPEVDVLDLTVGLVDATCGRAVDQLRMAVVSIPRHSLRPETLYALMRVCFGPCDDGTPEDLAQAKVLSPGRVDRLWETGRLMEALRRWLGAEAW
jgi:hypothetical protein